MTLTKLGHTFRWLGRRHPNAYLRQRAKTLHQNVLGLRDDPTDAPLWLMFKRNLIGFLMFVETM